MRPFDDSSVRIMVRDDEDEELDEEDEEQRESRDDSGDSAVFYRHDQLKQATTSSPRTSTTSLASGSGAIGSAAAARRQFKAYTVMQRSGFQHTEYVTIMLHLCRAEIGISLMFLLHGITCPGYPEEAAYQGTCHMNIVAALFGIFTGGIGIGAVKRYRWNTMLIMWLIMCIISSVGNLLAVITAGVWLDHLSKMKERTGFVNGLSGVMLLGSVAAGVCFILTAVMICHYWNSNSMKYQAVGRVIKQPQRSRTLARRRSKQRRSSGGGTEKLSKHAVATVTHHPDKSSGGKSFQIV